MIQFSIAQGTGAKQKNAVPTYICKSKWYRELMARTEPLCAQIEAETDKERRNALKANLPIKIPNAWMDDGAARNNKNAHPNGTMTLDFDGLDEKPRDLWERIKDKVMALNPIEVEISASGKGMHIWVLVPQGLTLKESIPFYAKRLGLEKFADKAVSDPARAIYIVPERNTLYRDWDALFGDKMLEAPVPTAEEIAEIRGRKALQSPAEPGPVLQKPQAKRSFPTSYQGIPFSEIVKELLRLNPAITLNEKGEPVEGCRHSAEVFATQQAKTLTDGNVEWLQQIIPNWEGDEKAWLQAISSAQSYEVKYESSNLLKQAIANLKDRQKQETKGTTDWRYADEEPRLPKYLPRLAKLLVERVPEVTWPSVINAAFSALATHTFGVWFRTIAGEKLELNMLTATLAETSNGKSASYKVNEVIMQSIAKADDEALAKEEEWKSKASRKSANTEGEKRPESLIRTCMSTMSDAVLMRRLLIALINGGMFLYSFYDEIKDLLDLSKSKRKIKAIMCAAFESKMYGKETDGKDFLSARAPMRFNTHFNGVPSDVKAWCADGLTDGYVNRISFAHIKRDRSQKFVYGDFDEMYAQKLEPSLKNLREKKGEIVCPEALEVARRLQKETEQYVDETEDYQFESLSRRALIIAHRKALILYVADGCRWSKELAKFMRWSFMYDMWVKMHYFGKDLAEAQKKEVVSTHSGPVNQLQSLPNTFTFEDYRSFRRANGLNDSKGATDATLRTWKCRKHVKQNPDGTYSKLKYTSK